MRPLCFALCAALALLSCSSDYRVERVALEGTIPSALSGAGLGRDEILDMLQSLLKKEGLLAPRRADRAVRVEVAVDDFQLAESREEAVATIILVARHKERSYEMAAHGAATATTPQKVAQLALGEALSNGVKLLSAQLVAFNKKRPALLSDLSSSQPEVREAALRVLVDRRDGAALPALLEKLHGEDPIEVRAAMGGMVEIGDPSVVPALIELAIGKEPPFQREILYALGVIGGEEAVAYLYTVSEGHDVLALREAARQALEEAQAKKPGDQERAGR
jgi:hypothetical protein